VGIDNRDGGVIGLLYLIKRITLLSALDQQSSESLRRMT